MTPYPPHTTVRIGCIRCHGRPRQQQGGNTGLYCPRCETACGGTGGATCGTTSGCCGANPQSTDRPRAGVRDGPGAAHRGGYDETHNGREGREMVGR